jgi:hypothetical protein
VSLLTSATTCEEVRSVLGVSSTELPDAMLEQPIHDMHLVLALEDIVPAIPEYYMYTMSTATKTADQLRFIGLVSLFAPYSVAKRLLTSLPMFAVQTLTDGRASFSRQSGLGIYDHVRDDVSAVLSDTIIRLKASYYKASGVVDTSVARITPFLTVGAFRGKDPVTNK